MALAPVRVLTEDVGRTLGFYEAIGCEHSLGDRAGPYVEVITPGGFRVGLDQQPEGPKNDDNRWSPIIGGIRVSISEEPPSDQVVLSIPVSDLESALAAARNAGGEILVEPSERQDLGLRLAHIRDPNGLLVELTSPIP
jgi:catechol 2,3-dioxygenase-like lactoylglutathione lyase family enzyme